MIDKKLRTLKKKTGWSWEKMCRQMHRVMKAEGPSHTTLFRYAAGHVHRPNAVTERYVAQAIEKINQERRP